MPSPNRRASAILLLSLAALLGLVGAVTGEQAVAAPSAAARAAPPGREPPAFSEVSQRTPPEVVAYLQGGLPEYPHAHPNAVLNFSPSDILETMDAVVLDWVGRNRGEAALREVYAAMAYSVLATLREGYAEPWVVVALDAGHGGKKGYYWDGGAGGTEADHARGVVDAMYALAAAPEFEGILLRPIYNDEIADDFGLSPGRNKPVMNPLVMRQARASMLAWEVATWNGVHPEASDRAVLHEISVHFNAGAGGAMVLHQGDTVRPEFTALSIDFAVRYLARVTAVLNAGGRLPAPLRLWGGNGLHDDIMMYRPDYLSDAEIAGLVLRYNGLQGGGYLPRYIATILAAWNGG
jgi:hypothetical protein